MGLISVGRGPAGAQSSNLTFLGFLKLTGRSTKPPQGDSAVPAVLSALLQLYFVVVAMLTHCGVPSSVKTMHGPPPNDDRGTHTIVHMCTHCKFLRQIECNHGGLTEGVLHTTQHINDFNIVEHEVSITVKNGPFFRYLTFVWLSIGVQL